MSNHAGKDVPFESAKEGAEGGQEVKSEPNAEGNQRETMWCGIKANITIVKF